MTTSQAAIFEIAEHCNREQFDELIGPFSGIVISDRWPGYEHLDAARRQVGWSHVQRDFRRHSEGLAEQKTFGEQGLTLTGRVFAAWRAYQHEHTDRARLQTDLESIQTALRALLQDAGRTSPRTRYHRRFANNLLKVWPALWTFITIDGVEPTNNPAERALRSPVIHRKLSTAAAHKTASDSPNARSPPPPPAANNTARCSNAHRPHPRRSAPGACLNPGLNGYQIWPSSSMSRLCRCQSGKGS
jgi:transposase